jgi:hypothetical protein
LPQVTKNKWFRIAALAAVLIGLYALAGFWWAPKLLRNALMQEIPKTLGLTPAVGDIRINPFLLQVELNDFSLTDHSGEKLLGFQRFFVNFELSSIWHRAFTFADIELAKPFVNAIVAKDGRINLLELEPKLAAAPAEKKNTGAESIPPVRIGSFKVSDGLLSYADRSTPSGFGARLEPINFELKDFTTGMEGGRFKFTGVSKLGERVEWHGHVSVQPVESDGEFQIDGLKVHTLWDYLEDKLNFVVNSGQIDLHSTYKFALKDHVDLHVEVQNIDLQDLTVRPRQGDVDWVSLPHLSVKDTQLDLAQRHLRVGEIALSGLTLLTWLEKGNLNLMSLAGPRQDSLSAAVPAAPAPQAPEAKTPLPTVAVAQPATPNPAWSVELHKFELRDAKLSAEDRSVKPAAKLLLAPLSITVDDASLDLSKQVDVTLDTSINDAGTLHLRGKVTAQPVSADLQVKLDGIDLTVAQPYINQYTSMTLLAGNLSGDTQLHYGQGKPALGLTGNLSVAKLHTVDNALHEDFISWDRLDVQGLNYQHAPDRLDIDQVTAQKAYARVIIEPDTSINVKRVLAGPGATLTVPAAPGSSAAPVAVTAPAPPPGSKTRARKPAAATPSGAVSNAPPPMPMPMSIKKIVLANSEADFADLTVKPNFATGIQKLQGSVTNLSSKPNSRAKIDLKGQVDPFAPVTISGEVNVLGSTLFTDVEMDFRNIELSTFNPYSGKFAGYNISKGKLTTELHYKVDGRKLNAQHHIVVDQLEFGDKTESKDAVSLPIKLAIALLKNREGVIDLNLPVEGTLDDPSFKLSGVIWKVFVNILEKAVTAPFALLGSLFGGGPDLQFVDFEPGTPDLSPVSLDKVHAIVKALNERPQLKIEVPIAAVKELDAPLLIDMQLKAQIQAMQSAASGRKKANPALPFEQLDAASRLDWLAQLYQKDVGAEPKYPEEVTAIKAKPDLLNAKIDYLNRELHSHITVGEAELTALGQARAANLQQALLTDSQIDPSRVFLVANDKAKGEGGKVRLELSLR